MSSQKWVSLSTSVTITQKQEIEKRAADSGMSVNEYIKARLFIDEVEEVKKANGIEKWMIKAISCILGNLEVLNKNNLSAEERKNLDLKIADIIRRSGFLKEEDIFKTKQEE
jgi:hypothetical protein